MCTDWGSFVEVLGPDDKPFPARPTYVTGLQPNPQPILHGQPKTEVDRQPRTTPPRDFPKLARFFRGPPEDISPALAEEAWASLIESTSRLESRGLSSAAACAAAWTAECSVPTILQIPGSARVQNLIISPLEGTGSWVNFHVQPDATRSQVGILREFL